MSTPPLEIVTSPGPSQHHSRNKSVQWADWELRDVMEFDATHDDDEKLLIDDAVQTDEVEGFLPGGGLPLVDSLVQTSMDISALARSRTSSVTTCTTMTSTEGDDEEDDQRQAALSDLITHLEDTAALLREYLQPIEPRREDADFTSYEQTIFLLKYQLVLVTFIQLVSVLLLTLFDHLVEKWPETGYVILTRSCSTILQILNMMLVIFATVVLSRQMLKYKVEGKFMAQTYLATVITFAGLYFVTYRFKPDCWEFGSVDKMEDNIAFSQYIKMLYLSVSAATLCGAANIQPRVWFVTLMLCFQSLINFVYFASILAQTIGNYHSYTVQVVRRSSSISRARSKST